MKHLFLTICIALFSYEIFSQTLYPENEPVENLPTGIFEQFGPGSNNAAYGWTYPYGTKLTVSNGSCCRNFEIGTTGYQSGSGDLVFRFWDPNANSWRPWRKIVLGDENGLVDIQGTLLVPNPSNFESNVNLSWHNDVARIRVGGTGPGSRGGLDIQTVGDQSLVRILHNGNVGIGSSNPGSKLTVKGDIHAEEVRVDLNVPGPDYVFEEDYDLSTLESLQNYIREHKHLPEIPSAMDMEENGIDLGVMNMLLLKKVEELTLHLIELDSRNRQQDEKIGKLESELKKVR